jgi:N-methylhydantoinase A/oxoprolinase/acetone carboxylase beta subunit
MSLEQAKHFPVLTISCGPTNSIRGAGYLSRSNDAIVIDVGGTTADAGVIVQGFPRESLLAANIGGVKTNFRMPDIISIALGGGTIIKAINNTLVLQKQSVGYNVIQKALAFGGDTFTLTDIAIANNQLQIEDSLSIVELQNSIAKHCGMAYAKANAIVHQSIKDKTEEIIDKLKTSKQEVDVLMVGGGSVFIPTKLNGVRKVIFPVHFEVANAFGAAIAQVGGEAVSVFNLDKTTREQAKLDTIAVATINAIQNGAKPASIKTLNIEEVPLAYLPNTIKIKAKVVGEI